MGSTQQSRPDPRREESADPPAQQTTAPPQQTEAQRRAGELTAEIDELLEEVDRTMKATLGFEEDEIIDPEELVKRADEYVRGFKNKGGQ